MWKYHCHAGLFEHAASRSLPPHITARRASMPTDKRTRTRNELAQPVDVTWGHSEKRDHREQERAGCSSGCSGADSGPGEIFARLAQRLVGYSASKSLERTEPKDLVRGMGFEHGFTT